MTREDFEKAYSAKKKTSVTPNANLRTAFDNAYKSKALTARRTALAAQQAEEAKQYKVNLPDVYKNDVDNVAKGAAGYKLYEDSIKKAVQAEEEKPWYIKVADVLATGNTTDTSLPTAMMNQAIAATRADESYRSPSQEWTDEERNAFGYLYAIDPKQAHDYAEETNNARNEHKKQLELDKAKREATKDGGSMFGNALAAIGAGLTGGADYLTDLVQLNARGKLTTEKGISPFEWSQAVKEGIGTKLNRDHGTIPEDVWVFGGKGWGDVYQLGSSIVESGIAAYTGGSIGTLAIFFGNAAAAGIDDAKARGATDDQAFLYGTLMGVAEGTAEKIGVDNLFRIGKSGKTGFINAAKEILKQAGAEGTEEGVTAVLGLVFDNMVMGDKSNYNALVSEYMAQGMSRGDAEAKASWQAFGDIVYDVVGGAVSGAARGTPQSVGTAIKQRRADIVTGRSIIELAGAKSELYDAANLSTSEDTKKLLERAVKAKKGSGKEARLTAQLARSVETEYRDQTADYITPEEVRAIEGDEAAVRNESEKTDFERKTEKYIEKQRKAYKEVAKSSAAVLDIGLKSKPIALSKKYNPETRDVYNYGRLEYNGDPREYDLYFEMARNLGLNADGRSFTDMFNTLSETDRKGMLTLDSDVIRAAFDDGVTTVQKIKQEQAAKDKIKKRAKEIEDAKAKKADEEHSNVEGNETDENANVEEYVTAEVDKSNFLIDKSVNQDELNRTQRTAIERIRKLAEYLDGVSFRITNTLGEIDGNGYYDKENKTVVININAGKIGDPQGVFDFAVDAALTHEIGHYIKEKSPQKFEEIKAFIKKEFYQYDSWDGAVERRLDQYRAQLGKSADEFTFEMAEEEVVCNSLGKMLSSKRVMKRLAGEHRSAFGTIWRFVRDFFEKLIGKISGYGRLDKFSYRTAEEEIVLDGAKRKRDKLEKMFADALVDANVTAKAEQTVEYATESKTAQNGENSGLTNTNEQNVHVSGENNNKTPGVNNTEVKYSLTDREYLAAVERGDMEAAQAMVDEAARAAGYTDKLYHGTHQFGFTEFDPSYSDDKISIFVAGSPDLAQTYSGRYGSRLISDSYKVDSMSTEEVVAALNKEVHESYDGEELKIEYKIMYQSDVNNLINEVNDGIEWLQEAVGNKIKEYADRMASDFNDKDAKTHSKLIELKEILDNYQYDYMSTPIYMLLHYTDAFDEGARVADLEYKIRLMNKLRNSDTINGVVVKTDLDGYGVSILYFDEARLELKQRNAEGNYALYGNPRNQLVIDGGGRNWNDLRNWIKALYYKVENTEVESKGDYYRLYDKKTGNEIFHGRIQINEANSKLPIDYLHPIMVQKANNALSIRGEYHHTTRDIARFAKDLGYESVKFENIEDNGGNGRDPGPGDVYAYFNPNNLKSADPITYDESGNVIPLSERFDSTKKDIRYSLPEALKSLGEYDSTRVRHIESSGKDRVVRDYDEIKDFIRSSRNNLPFERLHIGIVNDKTAALVKARTGEDIMGYDFVLASNFIFHIYDSHGNDTIETPRGQKAVDDANIENVIEAVISPDDVSLVSDTTGTALRFEKVLDGKNVAITITSTKKSTLTLKSAWIIKEKSGGRTPSANANAFAGTPEANGRSSTKNSISDYEPKINPSDEKSAKKSSKKRFALTESAETKEIHGYTLNKDADVNEDLLEELRIYDPSAEVSPDGRITVYHRTSEESAAAIRKTGIMRAKEDALFFSSKSEGYASDYGDTVLTFKIPSTQLRINDIFEGEVHFDMPLKRSANGWAANVKAFLDESSRFALPETDSNGETLTEAQREYFADSKVLDENGNLLALYHGTPKENGEFYVFDNNKAKRKGGFGFASSGKGFYFTTKREAAEIYTRSGGRLLSVYVDIKNPYIVNGDIKEQISNDFGIDPLNVYLQEVRRILSSKGYDGIIQGKGDAQIVVAYYPEQIKLTSNKNPTADPDIRYSLSDRELREKLAESFYGMAESDEERKAVEKYRSELNKVDEWMGERQQLIAEFEELRGVKGKSKERTEINKRIIVLNESITRHDEKLLKIAAAKPFRDVIDRYEAKAFEEGAAKSEGEVRMSAGQFKKMIADYTKPKVYSKSDAERAISSLEAANGVKGKKRAALVDEIWQGLNDAATDAERIQFVQKMSEKVYDAIITESRSENPEYQSYAERLDYLRQYTGRLTFSDDVMAEIKAKYDKQGSKSFLGRWQNKTNDGSSIGADVFVTDFARENPGYEYLEEIPVQDALFEINELYNDAVNADKTVGTYDEASAGELSALRSSIVDSILTAFDKGGEKSKAAKNYTLARADYFKNELENVIAINKEKINLDRIARKLRDKKYGTFQNATQIDTAPLSDLLRELSAFNYRGTISVNNVRDKVRALLSWYSTDNVMLEYRDPANPGYYNQEVHDILEALSSGKGDLSLIEYRQLYELLSYFDKFVDSYNKVWKNGKWIEAKEEAERFVGIIRENQKQRVGWVDHLIRNKFIELFGDPMAVARSMDYYQHGFYTTMMEYLRECTVKAQVAEMEMLSDYNAFLEKHPDYLKKAALETVRYDHFNIEEAKPERHFIPKLEIISLYMTIKRQHAVLGFAFNGFKYDDLSGNAVRVSGIIADPETDYVIIEAQVDDVRNKIAKSLSKADMEYISILESVYNNDAKELKRRRDMERWGFSNVSDGYYYPIRRSDNAKSVDSGEMQAELDRVSNASFNKDIVKGARHKLMIESADDLFRRHVRVICQYGYMQEAIEYYDKVYHVTVNDNRNNPKSIATETENWWRNADRYFRDLIAYVQGVRPETSERMQLFNTIRSGYAKYQLGANPKVWVTQLSSFVAACNIIDVSSLLESANVKADDVDVYCKLAKLRNEDNTAALAQGVFDRTTKAAAAERAVSKLGDVLMTPIGMMDRFVVKRLYAACQVQVAKDGGGAVGTVKNKKAAGELLERVILETQQNAMGTEKSWAMRSSNEILRGFTMFSADGMKLLARFIDAAGEAFVLHNRIAHSKGAERAKYEKRMKVVAGKIGRGIGTLVGSSVFMVLVGMLFKHIYARDDEITLGNAANDLFGNLIGGLPVIRDVYSVIFDGYDLENFAYSVFNDIVNGFPKLVKSIVDWFNGGDPTAISRSFKSFVYSVGQLTGIPTRNIYNAIYGSIKRFFPQIAGNIDDFFGY